MQNNFCDYLLSGRQDIANFVLDQGKLDRHTRLNIYKNAYRVRLRKCIETDHPILIEYLGDQLFKEMTDAYIIEYPSKYTSLRQYCDHLPTYLAQRKPFKSVPVLAEIANFERLMLSAFDAADCKLVAVETLQSITAPDWPKIKLNFHPSVFVFVSDWNSVDIWQALKNKQIPPEAKESIDSWVVWRGEDKLTQFRRIPFVASVMLNRFKDNDSFAGVCAALLEHLPEDEIPQVALQHLTHWLQMGIVHKIDY
ncbi:Conserved domain protein [uncultured Candidatus Thioglobus sp.]|nr:Conserved domain protein [uncultured Candidatus Thioglobus sp.]